MKIDKLELFKVAPRWLYLKITTDDGFTGWGEPVCEGKADSVAAAVRELGAQLIGHSATDVEDAFQLMYRTGFYRGGPILTSAISGIEQAMWDIKGKALGVPVYELLGGKVRDRIEVYCWIGGDHPRDTGEMAKEAAAQGYRAVKMNGTDELRWIDTYDKLEATVERVEAIREAVPGMRIAVDFHGRVHKTMAKQLMHMPEPYSLMFVEEPVLCENEDEFLELSRSCHIPIATGERSFTRWGFKHMLTRGGVDIIQPDVSHCGGILEARKIAAMAECFDVGVALHCPLGPIALAACFQVDFCSPNAFIQEQSAGIHYNAGYDLLNCLNDPEVFRWKDGMCDLLTRPGLGEVMSRLMPYVDVCIANEVDAKDVFGIAAENTDIEGGKLDREGYISVARQLTERFDFKAVAITLRGSISASDNNWSAMLYLKGSTYFARNYLIHLVDRVGGGDSFGGGLIHSMRKWGDDPQKCIEFAVAASCLKQATEYDFNLASEQEVLGLAGGSGSGRVQR